MKRNAVSKRFFYYDSFLFLFYICMIFILFAHIRHLCTGSTLFIHIINLEHYSTFHSFRGQFDVLYTYSFESLMVQWKMSPRSVHAQFARSQLPWYFNLRSSVQDMTASDTKEVRKPSLRSFLSALISDLLGSRLLPYKNIGFFRYHDVT